MATVISTAAYASKYSDLRFKKLGKANFTTSICGFGCYRVDDSIAEHHQALEFALENGINLIDTSSNYANGGSEKLVGNALRKLTSRNKNKLDEIIIVTKGGYLQADNLKYAIEREKAGDPFPDSEGRWHLRDSSPDARSVSQSRDRGSQSGDPRSVRRVGVR